MLWRLDHCGSKNARPDLHHHLIEVRRNNKSVGYILAIPYLRPADLPIDVLTKEDGGSSPLVRGIRQLYRGAIKEARARIGDLPLVVTGHLHVKGASVSESLSERRIVIGGEHAIPPDIFGAGADYVALGHLHRAQSFAGQGQKTKKANTNQKGIVRYAGSPLPLSAVERSYQHGVSLVDLTRSAISVEYIKLTRPVPFFAGARKRSFASGRRGAGP